MSPNNQVRIFQRQYAPVLLRIAKGDYHTALNIAKGSDSRLENAFFMIQQSIEKCLKSVLVHVGSPVPLVHNLGVLVAKLPANLKPPFGYELGELDQFASIRRYEEGQLELTASEMTAVADKAKQMLEWAEAIVHEGSATLK